MEYSLSDILNGIYTLPPESLAKISAEMERVAAGKHEVLVAADRICHDVYFVAKGIVRAFCYADGRDITFWIGAEGSVALSMNSYVSGCAGYETIVTLEDCVLYRISIRALTRLYEEDIALANWGRKFAEKEVLRAEKSLIPLLFTTGRERYETLLKEQPWLLKRLPQEALATYLGLTPVSLSRIRGQIQRGK